MAACANYWKAWGGIECMNYAVQWKLSVLKSCKVGVASGIVREEVVQASTNHVQ